MNIYVYIEPDYGESVWCKQMLRSVLEESAKRKYTVKLIEGGLKKADYDALYSEEAGRRLLLFISSSLDLSPVAAQLFDSNGIHMIFVKYKPAFSNFECSSIILDYTGEMRRAMAYLKGTGKKKTALFAVNPNSSTDLIKRKSFCDNGGSQDDIYTNMESLESCCASFLSDIDRYDSAICANDIAAVALARNIKAHPEIKSGLHIISFGDSLLLRICSPSVTSVAIDYTEIGRQCVYTYSFLAKNPSIMSVSVKAAADFRARESTCREKYQYTPSSYAKPSAIPSVNFCNDLLASELQAIENIISNCDAFDLDVIEGLLCGSTDIQVLQNSFRSKNTVAYRIKRFCRIAGIPEERGRLAALLKKHLSASDIRRIKDSPDLPG